jgi:hypothetical protein
MEDPSDLAGDYRQLREERSPEDRSRWLLLIKELRVTHNCSIYEAESLALLQPAWKRWVERQINGDRALIADDNGKLTVR